MDYDISFYSQNLLSSWFFSEKNLFIIDDFWWLQWETSQEIDAYTNFFLQNLPNASWDHVIVFNSQKVDKRWKMYKLLTQIWEIKNVEIPDLPTLKQKLQSIYQDAVSVWVIDKMIELKGNNFENIKNELDKILITKTNVSIWDLSNISKDLEENIFEIINHILQNEFPQWIKKMRELFDFLDNPYLFYNSFIGNLRFYFYVFLLQKHWVHTEKIKQDLEVGNRAFLLNKNYKISKDTFFALYDGLCCIEQKMKQWKLIWSLPEDILYEIEKTLLVHSL